MRASFTTVSFASMLVFACFAMACSAGTSGIGGNNSGANHTGANNQGGDNQGGSTSQGFGGNNFGGGPICEASCSPDLHSVVDCNGTTIETCTGDQGCNGALGTCTNACDAAVQNQSSVGCEYYATFMDQYLGDTACFAAFVANTWDTPVHVTVEWQGSMLPLGNFGYIASGSGPNQTYTPIDPAQGIPPGEIGVLFLSGGFGQVPCPAPSAMQGGAMVYDTTGVGSSFRISADVPVVTYQMNPYGGGSAATTGASLLLPTSVWGTNYVAANAGYTDDLGGGLILPASMNVVAMEDSTTVTMVPVSAIQGGGTLPPGAANTPYVFTLNKGQQAQFTQAEGLMGSILSSDKPVGVMAGNDCLRLPVGTPACDHAEQMVPPISALGSEYVGVMYRSRQGEPAIWTLVGAVDGTQLTWTGASGQSTINRGEIVELITGDPFDVKSQDDDHPFMMFAGMSGCWWDQLPTANGPCYGDPEWVISVPPRQYDYRYVFFTDPTYPETNLVLVRSKENDMFQDVNLDCLGVVSGWQPVGDYEWTRVDLSTGNFAPVGSCSTGRHEISSAAPFGLWVWGWGTPDSIPDTEAVSYGFPGGMRVRPINTVIIPPVPE